MVKLIAPSGAECEAEGDDLIAALKADGFTVEGEKKAPAKKAASRKKNDD